MLDLDLIAEGQKSREVSRGVVHPFRLREQHGQSLRHRQSLTHGRGFR